VANDKEEAGDVGPEVESSNGTSCPEMRWRMTIYLVKNLGWRGRPHCNHMRASLYLLDDRGALDLTHAMVDTDSETPEMNT
jgi:hypothetical protein